MTDKCPVCGSEWIHLEYHSGPFHCPKGIKRAHICGGCSICSHRWSERTRRIGAGR